MNPLDRRTTKGQGGAEGGKEGGPPGPADAGAAALRLGVEGALALASAAGGRAQHAVGRGPRPAPDHGAWGGLGGGQWRGQGRVGSRLPRRVWDARRRPGRFCFWGTTACIVIGREAEATGRMQGLPRARRGRCYRRAPRRERGPARAREGGGGLGQRGAGAAREGGVRWRQAVRARTHDQWALAPARHHALVRAGTCECVRAWVHTYGSEPPGAR